MNILLVGEAAAGTQALGVLRESGHRIVAVLSSPPSAKSGSGRGVLWNLAQKLRYETWPAQAVKEAALADRIRSAEVDILLNVYSLYIIRREVLEAPRQGCYNLHPGPLPRYAGLNSVCWAIYRGEKRHGVTLHKMLPEVDTGPIVFQEFVDITDQDTGLTLTSKCIQAGTPLIGRLLEAAAKSTNSIPLTVQDLTEREYFGKEVPQEGRILWGRPAREVFNFVRACDFLPFRSPWGYPRAVFHGGEIGIAKAALTGTTCTERPGTVGDVGESGAPIACGDEWLLVQKVMENERVTSATAILQRGDRLGD